MKIRTVSEVVSSPLAIRSKKDTDSHSQGFQRAFQEKNDTSDDSSKNSEDLDRQVRVEMERFAADEQATANGLNVTAEGTGPGLKVLLKDGRGGIIRQLTGEEFLKLREAVEQVAARGKIFDQKL